LNSNPMDFYLRQFDKALRNASHRLGQLVGASDRDLVFVDNATVAMNIVAQSLPLGPGDEVLLNDHEYGAVFRIWRVVCARAGAKVASPTLGRSLGRSNQQGEIPCHFENRSDVCQPILAAITPQTKLIVISHITSPTAIIFPVEEVCKAARQRDIPVCIDGPHAIAMHDVNLRALDCDFYCASLHKWLSAPFGSGFLYVHRNWHQKLTLAGSFELAWNTRPRTISFRSGRNRFPGRLWNGRLSPTDARTGSIRQAASGTNPRPVRDDPGFKRLVRFDDRHFVTTRLVAKSPS
jgi:isopenicillin-N epimerase